jgi:hypothetical protein
MAPGPGHAKGHASLLRKSRRSGGRQTVVSELGEAAVTVTYHGGVCAAWLFLKFIINKGQWQMQSYSRSHGESDQATCQCNRSSGHDSSLRKLNIRNVSIAITGGFIHRKVHCT